MANKALSSPIINRTMLLIAWACLTIINTNFIILPLLYLLGIVFKATISEHVCPLCFSFGVAELVYAASQIFFNHEMIPLWMLAVMISISAARVGEKLQQAFERNRVKIPYSWLNLNYWTLLVVIILVTALQVAV